MGLSLKKVLELLVMPPTSLFLAIALGLLLVRLAPGKEDRGKEQRRGLRRLGLAAAWSGGLGLLALSTPLVAYWLLDGLQTAAPIPPDATTLDAGAIVVLSGDVDCDPPEYGSDQPGALTMQRTRYGAVLARRTGLPLLLAGGVLRPDRRPVSHVMRDFVQDELGVPVRWTEDRSTTTAENALFTAELLEKEGIRRVALVTNAWHMPRAARAFERAGLEVLPAPTAPQAPPSRLSEALVPRGRSLRDSCWAVHEWIGRIWYRIRG